MRVLFIGDIVGKPGRSAVHLLLSFLKKTYTPDLTIANIENISGGLGIVFKNYEEISALAIDYFTSGNHIWTRRETQNWIDAAENLIRPANYPSAPGKGYTLFQLRGIKCCIINLEGRVFMKNLDCPFRKLDEILKVIPSDTKIKIVDFHAEATSEKVALGRYSDGRVSVILGTHTHIQTADAVIFPGGTGYITDVGMTGPRDSIIGMDIDSVINRFITQMPTRFAVPNTAKLLSYVVVDIDATTGKTFSIKNYTEFVE